MADVEIETFEPVEVEGALVVMAFHGTGAAASIAGSYLRTQLNLPLVGHIRLPDLGPVVQIQDGLATSPIRIFGGEVECHLDKNCPRLYVVTCDIPIPPELSDHVAQAVMVWSKGAQMILALDAVTRAETDHEPTVFSLSDSVVTLKSLAPAKVDPLPGGIIVGITAALLGDAASEVPTGALVVEAAAEHPDGRAAAALIAALDPLIEQIRVDVQPLLEEAMELEARVRTSLAQAEASASRTPHTFI